MSDKKRELAAKWRKPIDCGGDPKADEEYRRWTHEARMECADELEAALPAIETMMEELKALIAKADETNYEFQEAAVHSEVVRAAVKTRRYYADELRAILAKVGVKA